MIHGFLCPFKMLKLIFISFSQWHFCTDYVPFCASFYDIFIFTVSLSLYLLLVGYAATKAWNRQQTFDDRKNLIDLACLAQE